MANLETTGVNGSRRTKAPKVDLTPMVDLGFLLITFFIFTTTLSQSSVMKLFMPKDGRPTAIPESGSVTLIPNATGVYYFTGAMPPPGGPQFFSYAQNGALRQVLLNLRQQLITANGNDEKLMVLIKPDPTSVFKNIVDLLDEMTICGVRRYALLPLEPEISLASIIDN